MNEELPEETTSSPRTREASAPYLLGNRQGASDQLEEDTGGRAEESDPPILLGDGRADHTPSHCFGGAGMGKERAEGQRGQSTDVRGRNAPRRSVSSALSALTRKAAQEPKHRFRSLYRLIDLQMLYESFGRLKRSAAPGVDGVTVEAYEANLDENLRSLLERLIGKRYRAQPVKRRYIPKGGGKLRPLGIPSLEDKIVQHAASRILESIWESDFSDRSIGYRRGGPGGREASCQLARELDSGTYRWVVEADIASFFEDVSHHWLERMLEHRINDRAFLGLIRKWLKAGVLDAEVNRVDETETGTPQGGVISPVLANIYLHYVLDLWIEKRVRRESSGEVLFMRYADDIVVCFETYRDAQNYLGQLPGRLAKFSLRLSEEKTSLVKFNRWEPDESGKFTFLGFDFYWARTRKNPNHKMVRRRTNKKKYRESLRKLKSWIRKARSWPLRMILSSLRKRLRGYWNYYGVVGNSSMIWRYHSAVKMLVYKWLNRRSQRKSYRWAKFKELYHGSWQIPPPHLVEKRVRHARGGSGPQTELAGM
jgi:RNA-directed DNA polymerase